MQVVQTGGLLFEASQDKKLVRHYFRDQDGHLVTHTPVSPIV
jgi:hypothetical protein